MKVIIINPILHVDESMALKNGKRARKVSRSCSGLALARLLLGLEPTQNMNPGYYKLVAPLAIRRSSGRVPDSSLRMADNVFGSEIRASFSL